jgi:hypothetical protein
MGTNIRQTATGGMLFVDDASSSNIFEVGGQNFRNTKTRKIALTATAATTGGAVLAWQNPENVPIIVTRIDIDVLTKSTGAANISVGTAADGTTSSANLIDTYAIGGTEKVVNNIDDKGANGKSVQKMTTSQFITITGSATTAGLVANAYIQYQLT